MIHTYYQICRYQNECGLHECRKIVIKNGIISNIYERQYNENILIKFINSTPCHKYEIVHVNKV